MELTAFQKFMDEERWQVIDKFQKEYKTREAKEKALSEMSEKDVEFLIYCSSNIFACIFYSKFRKQNKAKTLKR